MKRIGIYFFCVVAIGCVTSGILYWENEKYGEIGLERAIEENTEQQETEDAAQTMENLINVSGEITETARFLIKEDGGCLIIYDQLTKQIYDETAIYMKDLPERLQLDIKNGMFFEDEKELYEFLENYSS